MAEATADQVGRLRRLLETIEMFVRRVGSHCWFWRCMFIAGLATIASLYVWPQPPGVAVGILAFGAIIMTFREMTATHKLLWACFAIALLILEYRAIYHEHEQQEAQGRASLDALLNDNRIKTKAILDSTAKGFGDTESHFGSLGDLSEQNLRASNDALANITGGNSVVYFAPRRKADGHIQLAIWNNGKYRVNNVGVSIHRLEPHSDNVVPLDFFSVGPLSWGDVVRDWNEEMSTVPHEKLWLLIDMPTGMESEVLEFRSGVDGKPEYRIDVNRVRLPTLSEEQNDSAYHGRLLYRRPWTVIK